MDNIVAAPATVARRTQWWIVERDRFMATPSAASDGAKRVGEREREAITRAALDLRTFHAAR
jgi:hypothetical protein